MTRKERIRAQMTRLEELGVIEPGQSYTQGQMPGLRWVFTPRGFSERSLTTSQVEDFILGAQAALNVIQHPFDEGRETSLRPRPGETPEQTVERVIAAVRRQS